MSGDQIQRSLNSPSQDSLHNQTAVWRESRTSKFRNCCPEDQAIRLKLEEQLEGELRDVPNEESLKENAKVLRALSHPLRLQIGLLLLKRDHCVCELVQLTGRKRNLVSHHLSVMRRSGVVHPHVSRWKYYRLDERAVHILRGFQHTSDSPTQFVY